ncbi:DUF3857 domain-containing protein [Mangrovimonas sp. DI 80]|uniref:DUF3857 domain-containing protein n=1 Tax=Mangrovimonas sp. DI 80 TaxID=1779330 RepID=UPI0009785103|nr:DUF3857 domain-containing protein [Mangrovimonas sp. DI 80]OMP31553.1 hypothetical protein BKM32_07490 [Mangrovimonas sp. DI 80]
MKKVLTTLLILFLGYVQYAQDYDFGKVSKQELEGEICPQDSSANAVVLYKNEKISFEYIQGEGFMQNREVHERIKIYNKEGFHWATKKIRLYNSSASNSENLSSLKGYTFNLIDGKIEKEKLKKESIFEEEANKYWKFESFTMPNVKDGCVIEYAYRIKSPYLQIDDINFQYTIPILKSDLKISTPEYYIYNKLLNPKSSYIPKLNLTKEHNSFTINSKARSTTGGLTATKTEFSQSKTDYMDNVITINEVNIPALKDEPLVGNIDNYRAKLILELTAIKYPNKPLESFSSSWEKVTKTIYDSDEFGIQLDKTGYYEEDLENLIAGETNVSNKITLIYNHVKSKVKWNGYYGYRIDNGVRKAYKEGTGNVGDINLILVSMLRSAGVKANPVLISTKNNGIPLFPTRDGFNYVICMIEDVNFNVLLDATNDYSTVDILPTRALNWQGRVIRENGSSAWIDLQPKVKSEETVLLNIAINTDLTVGGKVRENYTNYMAMQHRNRYANISPDDLIKIFEKNKGEIVIENLEINNAKDVEKPLQITYEFQSNDAVEEIAGKLYFAPMLFLATSENPFKQIKRNYPITMDFPVSTKYMVNVMIPEGYEVETLPESSAVDFNNGGAKLTYVVKKSGKYLQLLVNLDLNTTLVLPEDYEYFKGFFKSSIEKHNEKVVLKKII